MEILLIESDRLIRDQIKVGLQQFPDFQVTWGESYPGINQARMREFNYVFLGVHSQDRDALRLLEHLREFDLTTDVVIVGSQRICRDLAGHKARYGIHAFLHAPITELEFFRLVARLRDRKSDIESGVRPGVRSPNPVS